MFRYNHYNSSIYDEGSQDICFCLFRGAGTKPRASNMLSKCTTTELHLCPLFVLWCFLTSLDFLKIKDHVFICEQIIKTNLYFPKAPLRFHFPNRACPVCFPISRTASSLESSAGGCVVSGSRAHLAVGIHLSHCLMPSCHLALCAIILYLHNQIMSFLKVSCVFLVILPSRSPSQCLALSPQGGPALEDKRNGSFLPAFLARLIRSLLAGLRPTASSRCGPG